MRKLFFLLALSCLSLSVFAQKVGHVNTGLLLEGMSTVKAANTELDTYQQGLVAQGQKMVEDLQTEYNAFVAEVQKQTMTPKAQQEQQVALQKKQQEIQAFEKEVQNKILEKREVLLKPILSKVDAAIKEVGKEGDFLFIFDVSVPNTILFADEPLDVTDKVKTKLGI